jgi:hypothetical protein
MISGWEKNEFRFAFRNAQFYLVGRRADKTFGDCISPIGRRKRSLVLSDVSIWEMQIKVLLGKMKLKLR